MFEIVSFYIESINKSESTKSHAAEIIQRTLLELSEGYAVAIEPEKIRGLTPSILQRWYNGKKNGRSVSTMNNYVCMINPFIRWLQDRGYLFYQTEEGHIIDLANILHTDRLPKPESLPPSLRPKDKYMTHDEAAALMHCTGRNAVRDKAIISLFLHSGLRVSELCSLNLADVLDRPQGTMEVLRKGGEWAIVDVAPQFYIDLAPYLATRNDLDDHSRPLFMTTHGERINRKQVHKFLSRKQKNLGLATGPHALRHTFLSETEKIGGAAIARDLANQKSLAVTNRYVHTTPEQRQSTVRKLQWNTTSTHDHNAQD